MVSTRRAARPLPASHSRGFAPIVGANARVLVLGSLPGRKSLEMSQYYAQPQNSFWRIMERLFGAGPSLAYPARLERLLECRVAVWDVLAAGERSGSLDSAIVTSTIVINDFPAFFEQHPGIRLVCFNGAKAAEIYRRRVLPVLAAPQADLESRILPSTSPANAALNFDAKLERWSSALAAAAHRQTDAKRSARR